MTTVFWCVGVVPAQFGNIVLAPQNAGYDDLMQRNTFDLQTVKEVAPDVVQQNRRTGHQIRNAAGEAVDGVIGTGADKYQLGLSAFCLAAVGYRAHAVSVGLGKLHIVKVGKSLGITRHAAYPVFYQRTVRLHKLCVAHSQPYRLRCPLCRCTLFGISRRLPLFRVPLFCFGLGHRWKNHAYQGKQKHAGSKNL